MYQDIADLNRFYRSRLGQVARRLLAARIRALWPDIAGLRLAGLGHVTPYLRVFQGEAERVASFAPAAQGAIRQPGEGAVCLADEFALPLPDGILDRVLMVHALEHSEARPALMRETWRVLADGGRLLVVVANRRGLWARADHTPFGHGHPFNEGQIDRALRESLFTPLARDYALYVPPSQRGLSLWSAPAWERIGRRWSLPPAGVVLVEASKRLHGVVAADGRRRPLPATAAASGGGAPSAAPGAAARRWPDRRTGWPGLRSRG